MAYLVKKQLKMLSVGLTREPGQHVTDADFRTCPGLRDALLKEGAIVKHDAVPPAAPAKTTGAFGQPLMPDELLNESDIDESPAEKRRRGRKAAG